MLPERLTKIKVWIPFQFWHSGINC